MERKVFSTIALLLAIVGLSQGQDFKQLETRIDSMITNKVLPSLAVGVLKGGEIIYEKAFGYSDHENKVKSTVNTPYQLASLSKPITATAIMKLHEDGVININEPITKYISLKKVDSTFQDPTIRQVLNHTSGLGTYFDIYYEDESISTTSFEEAWGSYGTQFHEPGKVCEYSNIGYGLLSYIISKVTSEPFEQYLQTGILDILNMNHSFVIEKVAKKNQGLAKKYGAGLEELPFIWNNTSGAGNIASSIRDMMQFASLHLQNSSANFLESSAIRKMQTYLEPNALFHYYQDTYYGLGWYIMKDDNGQKVVWHEGGMMGASTILKLYPKENIAIVLITNIYNPSVCRALSDTLTSIIMPDYQPTPLSEITQYRAASSDTTLFGSWEGFMHIEKEKIPVSLKIKDDAIEIGYLNYGLKSFLTDYQPLPVSSKLLFGAINQDYFIGTGIGELPASDKRKNHQHLLSFKLYKDGTSMKGTIINLAAAKREYYARPYYIELKKAISNQQ